MKVLLISSDRTGGNGLAVNLGDAFLTDQLAAALTERGHDVTALDFGDADRADGSPRTSATPRQLPGLIRQHDVVVVGGGTLLQKDSPAPLSGLVRLVTVVGVLCRLLRRPLALFAVGMDPIPTRVDRAALRVALAGSRVWVRDRDSLARVERLTKKPDAVALAADASLLRLDALADERASAGPVDPEPFTVIALNLRDAATFEPADTDADHPTVFLSMYQGDEQGDYRGLSADARASFDRIENNIAWRDALHLVGRARHVTASRMHALYMALIAGTPWTVRDGLSKLQSFESEFSGTPAAQASALRSASERAVRSLDEMLDHLAAQSRRSTAP